MIDSKMQTALAQAKITLKSNEDPIAEMDKFIQDALARNGYGALKNATLENKKFFEQIDNGLPDMHVPQTLTIGKVELDTKIVEALKRSGLSVRHAVYAEALNGRDLSIHDMIAISSVVDRAITTMFPENPPLDAKAIKELQDRESAQLQILKTSGYDYAVNATLEQRSQFGAIDNELRTCNEPLVIGKVVLNKEMIKQLSERTTYTTRYEVYARAQQGLTTSPEQIDAIEAAVSKITGIKIIIEPSINFDSDKQNDKPSPAPTPSVKPANEPSIRRT